MKESSVTAKASAGRTATILHVVGNIFLGIALGLLAYYAVTDLVASASQAGLESELEGLGPIAEVMPPVVEVSDDGYGALWDLEGWESEDLVYWESLEEGEVFGRLVIDGIGLDTVVVKGTDNVDLRKGPGWIAQTDLPGSTGNCGISGHRTTYGAPFRRLDEVEPGDEIVFFSPYRRYVYEMTEQLIVRPNETGVVASTVEPMITLTACHPVYSAAYRLVVQGRLVEVRRLETGY